MLGCDATSLEVVQLDQINLGSGVFIADGDDGHLVAHPAHMLRIVRRVQEDGGKEAAAKRHIQICVLLLHPVIRVAADQMETVGGSSQLQFMKNKGIVGIRQITDQDQNGMLCAFPAALAALGLGIVQLPGRGKDPLGGLQRDGPAAFLIQHKRNGGLRYAGQPGNIGHGRFSLFHGCCSLLCGMIYGNCLYHNRYDQKCKYLLIIFSKRKN